jgi:hypothetical protein
MADSSTIDPVADWLARTPVLSRFCTQNGWVDGDTLRYEVRQRGPGRMRINVHFIEIVMEGAGCVAARVECYGQLDLELDAKGRVIDANPV